MVAKQYPLRFELDVVQSKIFVSKLISFYDFNAKFIDFLFYSIFLLVEIWLGVSVMMFLSSKQINLNVLLIIFACFFSEIFCQKYAKYALYILFVLDYKASIALILKYIRSLIYLIIFLNNSHLVYVLLEIQSKEKKFSK